MRELLLNAVYGAGSYFQSNHMAVLAMGTLLYCFAAQKELRPRERRLLALAAVMLALVLFPVSSAALMLYQTRFYGYHWIWSLVPVTACIAWGSTSLLEGLQESEGPQESDGRRGWHLAAGMAALLALLLLLGNLGNIRAASGEEKEGQRSVRSLAALLEELPGIGDELVWAPGAVLGELRRQSGEIKLLYGRDMWEPAAAAYAYDTYPMEQQHLFDWMEALARGEAAEIPLGLSIFLEEKVEYGGPGDWERADAYMLQLAAQCGSRTWVFPAQAAERVSRASGLLDEEYGLRAQQLGETAGYVVWRCE